MSELQEVVEILNLSWKIGDKTLDLAIKTGGMGLEMLQFFCSVLWKAAIGEYQRSGKTNIDQLINKEGGELQCFQFDEKDWQTVKIQLKKRGILYSVLPGLCRGDGKKEIMFHSSAAPRINSLIEEMMMGITQEKQEEITVRDREREEGPRIISFTDYLNRADPGKMEEIKKEFREEMRKEKGKGEVEKKKEGELGKDGGNKGKIMGKKTPEKQEETTIQEKREGSSIINFMDYLNHADPEKMEETKKEFREEKGNEEITFHASAESQILSLIEEIVRERTQEKQEETVVQGKEKGKDDIEQKKEGVVREEGGKKEGLENREPKKPITINTVIRYLIPNNRAAGNIHDEPDISFDTTDFDIGLIGSNYLSGTVIIVVNKRLDACRS